MKTRLIFGLVVTVALVLTLVACGKTTDTTAAETKAPAVTTTNAETTAPTVSTTTAETTEPIVTTTPLDGADANAAYAFVCNKMNMLKGFEAKLVESSGIAGETSVMEADVKLNYANAKKGFMSVTMEDGSLVETTYIDGVVYCLVKMSGFEMKYKTQDESMTSSFETLFDTFEAEDPDALASVVFGTRENGVYTLVVTLTQEGALELLMEEYEGLGIDGSEFSNVSTVATYECNAEGFVTKVTETLTYTWDGDVYSETATCTFKNIGKLPDVKAPADADSYMDMDEME